MNEARWMSSGVCDRAALEADVIAMDVCARESGVWRGGRCWGLNAHSLRVPLRQSRTFVGNGSLGVLWQMQYGD